MNKFTKMCVSADIDEAIDFLRQMQGCVLDGDVKGAEHFLDKVVFTVGQLEYAIAEADTRDELVMDEA